MAETRPIPPISHELRALLRERVLVCGDRNWNDPAAIRRELERLDPAHTTIVHGAARGADSIAGRIARELGFEVEAHPAEWQTYGKGAGPIRNRKMLSTGIDRAFAFHPDLEQSKGTADMVGLLRSAGIPVTVFDR